MTRSSDPDRTTVGERTNAAGMRVGNGAAALPPATARQLAETLDQLARDVVGQRRPGQLHDAVQAGVWLKDVGQLLRAVADWREVADVAET